MGPVRYCADLQREICFDIWQESGAYWQVCLLDGTVGWLENELCMINLPDVLPSIVYENPKCQGIDL